MDTIEKIIQIPKDQLLKPKYGSASLLDWESNYNELIKKLTFINEYWNSVDNNTRSNVFNVLGNIYSWFTKMINADERAFINDKTAFKDTIGASFETIKQNYPAFIAAAMEYIGINDLKGYKKELEKQKIVALKAIEDKSKELLISSKEKANKIETVARNSAKKVSVKDAQDQFKNGAQANLIQVIIWGGLTAILIGIIIYWICVMLQVKVPERWDWQFGYESIVRIIIIGFSSTLLTFTLKMLKSNLHLREHNLHRLRISNSIQAFVESATEQNQRDIILTKLIDSVVEFGNSGLIDGSQEKDSKITIETLTGALTNMKS